MVSAKVVFLFAVYLDNLLCGLSLSGVGCCWRWMFAGVFCFADDIVILAPCASALRRMQFVLHLHHHVDFCLIRGRPNLYSSGRMHTKYLMM